MLLEAILIEKLVKCLFEPGCHTVLIIIKSLTRNLSDLIQLLQRKELQISIQINVVRILKSGLDVLSNRVYERIIFHKVYLVDHLIVAPNLSNL